MSNKAKSIKIIPDEIVEYDGETYRIMEILDFYSVVATHIETGRSKKLPINLLVKNSSEPEPSIEVTNIQDSDWKKANLAYAIIRPLLAINYGKKDVIQRSEETNISVPTIYRYLKRFQEEGGIEGLIPNKRGVKKGTRKLDLRIEAIISDVIENRYLSNQLTTAERVVEEVRRRCYEMNIKDLPHANTIRSRINDIPDQIRLKNRRGRDKANSKYLPVPGKFEADHPLQVVQVDHTLVDLILVDDKYRKSIGRPWVTMAIDVFSRAIVGYYLSFDSPSATSIAMCVAHSVLPKDSWLQLHGVDEEWPIWGLMETLHVDNGSDFRSESFRKACQINAINLEYRPVKQPRFGGHIERLLGTVMTQVHDLPGTTFSNIKDRENYNSEKKAIMTLSEFEKWLVTYITKVYHKKRHSQIGTSPEKMWEIGIFGNQEIQGIGLRSVPSDPLNFLISFLPLYRRTVQNYGISLNGLNYYSDALRTWINASDDDDNKQKKKFIIRQDPRDISSIWFYDPVFEQYFEIPFANQSLPSMSIWEYQRAKKHAVQDSKGNVTEYQILQSLQELRELADDSAKKTKSARKKVQQRKNHKTQTTPINQNDKTQPSEDLSNSSLLLDESEINEFGDVS